MPLRGCTCLKCTNVALLVHFFALLVHLRQVHPLKCTNVALLTYFFALLVHLFALLVHLRQVHPLKAPPGSPLMILSAKLLQTADSTKQMQQKRRCPLRATP